MKRRKLLLCMTTLSIIGIMYIISLIVQWHEFYQFTYKESIVFNSTELLMAEQYHIYELAINYGEIDTTKPYFSLLNSEEEVATFELCYQLDLPDYRGKSIVIAFNAQLDYAYSLATMNKQFSSFILRKRVFDETIIPEFMENPVVGTIYVYECYFLYSYLGLYDADGVCHQMVGERAPKG